MSRDLGERRINNRVNGSRLSTCVALSSQDNFGGVFANSVSSEATLGCGCTLGAAHHISSALKFEPPLAIQRKGGALNEAPSRATTRGLSSGIMAIGLKPPKLAFYPSSRPPARRAARKTSRSTSSTHHTTRLTVVVVVVVRSSSS